MPAAAPTAASTAKIRLDHIDGIRAVAALIVFLNHAYAQTWDVVKGPLATGILEPAKYSLVAGHLSVTVFIVVSGFCLTLPVVDQDELRGGVRGFLQRRARRILPPYYAAVFLCLALIWTLIGDRTGTLWDVPVRVKDTPVTSIGFHLLLLQDLFATSHINYVFWSIAVEWQIYFFMPLFVWAWAKRGPVPVVVGTLVVGYALTIAFGDTRVARAHPQYLGMFALGMLAAYLARSKREVYVRLRGRVPYGAIAAAGLATTSAITVMWGVGRSTDNFHVLDLPVGIMAAATLVASSKPEPSVLTRCFGWKPLVAIGTFSYSLYLIHAPLLQVLWQYVFSPLGLDKETTFMAFMSAGLAFVLLAAYGFHLLFEAPFMKAPNAARNPVTAPVTPTR